MRKKLVIATDTDVAVIAYAVVQKLDRELWIAFGHGVKLRFIPCHLLSSRPGPLTSEGLLYLHALTGCDITSAFRGIGKKTAWNVYISMPELPRLFTDLSRNQKPLSEADLKCFDT